MRGYDSKFRGLIRFAKEDLYELHLFDDKKKLKLPTYSSGITPSPRGVFKMAENLDETLACDKYEERMRAMEELRELFPNSKMIGVSTFIDPRFHIQFLNKYSTNKRGCHLMYKISTHFDEYYEYGFATGINAILRSYDGIHFDRVSNKIIVDRISKQSFSPWRDIKKLTMDEYNKLGFRHQNEGLLSQ